MSQYVLTWKQEIHNKPKLAVYSQYKTEFATEVYCEMNIKRSQRSLVAKFRYFANSSRNWPLQRHRKRKKTMSSL